MIEYKQLKKNGELTLLNLIIGHGHWSLVSGHHRDYTGYIAFDKTIPSGA